MEKHPFVFLNLQWCLSLFIMFNTKYKSAETREPVPTVAQQNSLFVGTKF